MKLLRKYPQRGQKYAVIFRSGGSRTRRPELQALISLDYLSRLQKDGILRVTFGKREEARPKPVEVKVK